MTNFKDYLKKVFDKKSSKSLNEEKPKSEGYCRYCKKMINGSEEYYCDYCKSYYCFEHRMPPRHSLSAKEKCPGDT